MEIKKVIIPFETKQKLIWKHSVERYEVEEVFNNHPRIEFAAKGNIRGEDLYTAKGQTESGRYLIIFFIKKPDSQVLVISAREMDSKERKSYAKKR